MGYVGYSASFRDMMGWDNAPLEHSHFEPQGLVQMRFRIFKLLGEFEVNQPLIFQDVIIVGVWVVLATRFEHSHAPHNIASFPTHFFRVLQKNQQTNPWRFHQKMRQSTHLN